MAYQRAREGREVQHSKIEQEVAALKPAARKTRVQSALNEQVVAYFNLVHEARNASPRRASAELGKARGDTLADGPHRRQSRVQDPERGSPAGRRPRSVTEGEALEQSAIDSWREERLRELLRENMGFCTVVKQSTIPGAGVGLFVEGSAPEGAVVAIYPGFVHLPENLRQEDYMSTLLPDKDFFLMGRADGCVIDGRAAEELPASPLAVAQAVNHPPKNREANTLQAAYDYPSEEGGGLEMGQALFGGEKGGMGGLFFPSHLRPLIPNRYKVPPKLFGGKIDRWALVETVVLVARRGGLHDEEVFMDYRFNPAMKAPSWYTPVKSKEMVRMWAPQEERDSGLSQLFASKDRE